MKILVTGSRGFIAGHLIEHLHGKGYKVVGLDRQVGKLEGNPWEPDELFIGDVRDRNLVDQAVSMVDGVINLAGILGSQETVKNPYPSVETNIFGALNCLEACTTWGVPMVQIAVGNHWENNSYSISKTTAERLALMYARERGTKVNVVRALNAIGTRQKAYPVRKILASFITRALNNEDIEIYGDGEQLMDLVYVKDVAKVLEKALHWTYGSLLEAGTGVGLSVNYIAHKVVEVSGSKSKITHLPMRPGETPGSQVVAEHPFDVDYKSFEEVLPEIVEWYRLDKSKQV